MSGFITKTECQKNRQYIIDTWGEAFYNACLEAEGETFLSLLISWGLI
jgi:hypothetical protein